MKKVGKLESWKVEKITDVFELRPPKKEARDLLSENDLVSFLPMEDLDVFQRDVIATKEKPLKEVSGSYTYFANNDVLLAKITPCFENGKLGIARNLKNGIGFGSSEYIVFRSQGKVIPEYLFYYLARDEFRRDGEKAMTGAAGQKRIPPSFVGTQEIAYPPISEQQRIVSVLDEAFASIAQAKSNAERNLQNAKELLASLLIKVFLEGINNKKWSLEKLEKYNKVVVGYVGPISKDYTNDDDGILLLSTKNISDNGINLEKLTRINRQFHNKNKKSQLVPGDILVARHGNSGQAAVIPDSIKEAHALNVIVIKNSSTLSSEYLTFLLNSGVLDKISSSKAGSVQAIINTSIIKDLVIPVPPLAEQRAIVGRLEALSAETGRLEEIYQSKLEALEELKRSVLAKAFAGEL